MLKPGDQANFQTLKLAFENRDAALVQCKDLKTGEYVAVIAAVQVLGDGSYQLVPLARLFAGNPYEEVAIDAVRTETDTGANGVPSA